MGMRREKWTSSVDASDLASPLDLAVDDSAWTYSDGSDFTPGTDFGLDLGSFGRACVHLRATAAFAARVTDCENKEFAFFCRWTGTRVGFKKKNPQFEPCPVAGLDCPTPYSFHGSLSDGRTCHGVLAAATAATNSMCHGDAADDLRRPSIPTSPLHAQLIAKELRSVVGEPALGSNVVGS